jgi:hypothetical protein
VRKSGGAGELAILFENRGSELRMLRDVPHKPESPGDKQEVDRPSDAAVVLSVAADGSGKLELSSGVFVGHAVFTHLEEYDFVFGTEAGNDTLTLTETSARLVPPDGGASEPDAGTPEIRPSLHLVRAGSWCARTFMPAVEDCTRELAEGIYQPTAMPPECKGHEDLCLSCVAHACKTHTVSSCELAGNFCRASIEDCEFRDGRPAGQVAEIDNEGKPIDCNGARKGAGVCCVDPTGFSLLGDDDDDR